MIAARHANAPTPVHEIFRAQAKERPEAVALAFEERRLSYGELYREVERLAAELRFAGVGPEVLVAIAVERSPEMVIALLAVLEAGGAYVPLDPAYPADRLRFMLEDSGAGLILTTGALAARLPEVPGALRLLLDGERRRPPRESPTPDAALDLEHLAYVMYTSGSTGRPKGVAVPHRGLANLLPQIAERMAVTPAGRVLQLASLSFDASVLEIFLALTRGASLHLVARTTLLSGEALAAVLRERAITTLAIPPSLLSTLPDGTYPDLAAIVLGGEAPSAELVRRFQGGRILLNAYAPTEATILITAELCQRASEEPPALGEALSGGEMLLLQGPDPAPAGEAGEIHLGGAALARGYHGRPALTAERFVPHPAPRVPGSRLYKSGDLARRRQRREVPEEALFFAGRADSQVKLRGVRLELGEVEAVLRRHPAVREAVAAVRRDHGDERLVAYFVPAAGAPPASAAELRAFAAGALPAAMIPGLFVPLAALPVTPTGKVDRDALPRPGRERPALATAYEPPRGETEAALARIAAELLGVEEVGRGDSFFELGGHSLLLTRIAAKVREELAAEISLLDLFERPTVAALAEALRAAAPRTLPPLRPGERTSPIPLTYPQERIWFLNQLAPAAISYAFQFTLRFSGTLLPSALGAALSEIIRRHEVLRTGFPAVAGRPVQEIHPPFRAALPLVDLGSLPAEQRAAQAERLVARGVRRPIAAERPPLVLWTLFRLGPADHLLLQVEHHFVHDGWSLAVFLGELKDLYHAFARGLASPLPEPPVQYADFACWQRRFLARAELATELAFWKDALADMPLVLELPADRPRPKAQSFRGDIVRDELPRPLYEEVRAWSRRHGVTLFTTMLAVFEALLVRLTGRSRFLLGSGVANRRLAEIEGLLGMVVNTVVLPANLTGNPPFVEALARARKAVLAAHGHQDLPFEKLVEELAPARDLSHNPLVQVMFSFHDSAVPEFDLPGLRAELLERHNGSAKVDLNVVVKPLAEQRAGQGVDAGGDLTMVWEFATDLFDRTTIERLWQRYQGLLAAVLATPEARLADLPLLTAVERDELTRWGAGPAAETFVPVPLAVRAAVAADADKTAVSGINRLLTYGELWRQACTLALAARAEGAGPERVVAVLFERSPELVVALLATHLCGAAFLPIDPAYPAERIRFMLEDARAALLVGRRRLAAALGEIDLPMLLLADGESWPEESEAEGAIEVAAASPEQLAYLIYTSGSTGQPKGVMVTHRGLSNLVAWHREEYSITPADRASHLAGLGFDASVWETWPPLAAGASLHLVPEPVRSAPIALLDWLSEEGISRAFLPTPLAEGVLAELADGRRSWRNLALRTLLTGGDRLHQPPAQVLPFELVNHYGPTEAAVVATAAEVFGQEGPPPIGRPIRGFTAVVAGLFLTRQPPGVPGQLLLGGEGLARGYHRRPALTAARFLPHPWATAAGERAYATGDLVRFRPDGQLEFLGRIDAQVKIRGFRIELGEIEAQLRRQSSVADAVVIAGPASDGAGAELLAYVVTRAGFTFDPEEVRRHLERHLPLYMVPPTFTQLAELPLTAHGKVDLRALPKAEGRGTGEAAYQAPRTETESFVAELWADLLRLERVGVHDHFFRLGGHSLIATRLLARIHDLAGVELPLSVLFESPTVAGLALAIEDRLLAELATSEEVAAVEGTGRAT